MYRFIGSFTKLNFFIDILYLQMKNFNIQFIFDKIRINYLLKKIEVNSYNLNYKLLSNKLNFKKKYIDSFLEIFKRYDINLTNKEFNMIYFINYHPQIVFIKKNELSKKLVQITNNVIDVFSNFDLNKTTCIFKVYIALNSYSKLFKKWLVEDKEDIVKDLTFEYLKTEDIIEKFNKYENLHLEDLDNINILKKFQNNILNKIININGENILKNIKPIDLITMNQDMDFSQMDRWSLLSDELKEIPINYKTVILILKEIKNIIYSILDKRYNILIDVEKNFDIFSLNNDSHNLLIICNYLFDLLFKIQSKKYDEVTIIYHKELKMSMIEGTQLYRFLPKILKYLSESYETVLYEKKLIINNFSKLKIKN